MVVMSQLSLSIRVLTGELSSFSLNLQVMATSTKPAAVYSMAVSARGNLPSGVHSY